LEYLLPAPKAIAKVKNHDALPYAELGAFMAELRDDNSIVARALEFTILTCARTGETGAAAWTEIDDRTWTISAERMKAGKAHRVPLPPRVLEILAAIPRGGEFIFSGSNPLHDRAMYRLLRQMRPGISVHGFRSVFSTWANECTAFPPHIIEHALAHDVGSAVERAYKRTDLFDKRRKLMAAWATFCSTPQRGATVTPIGVAR
jgi:integrase